MARRGVFAVARAIWTDPDFADEQYTEREAFMWLVGDAAWIARKVRGTGRHPVTIARGEISHSVRHLADQWKWDKDRAARFLNRLLRRDILVDTSRDGARIFKIKNYNNYQIVGLPERDSETDTESVTDATPMRQTCDNIETLEHSNIEKHTSDKSDPRPKKYPEQFEEFWKAYPTDKLMSKAKAGAYWRKLSPEDRALAIAAIPGFRDHCRKNPTYRAVHAVRFLSERRFEGFVASSADPAKAAEARDRADQFLKRGKYAETMQ